MYLQPLPRMFLVNPVSLCQVHYVFDQLVPFEKFPPGLLNSHCFARSGIITGRPRNCSAHCADGCVLLEMAGSDFLRLTKQSPDIMSSLRDLSLRRDFKKAGTYIILTYNCTMQTLSFSVKISYSERLPNSFL